MKAAPVEGGPSALETMVTSQNLKPDQIAWLVQERLLNDQMSERMIMTATEKGRTDILEEAGRLGLIKTISKELKNAALFTATATRNENLVDFWMKQGADPYAPMREGLSAAGIAAKLQLLGVLKRLDVKGTYKNLMTKTGKEYPPQPKSPLLGVWSNKRDGFGTVSVALSPDSTGTLATAIAALPILWKSSGPDQITLVIVGPNGPIEGKSISLKYEKERNALITDKKDQPQQGEDPGPLYRIKNP